MKKATYDDAAIERIAKEAVSDPRTVLRYLAGLPVRGKVSERIKIAIEKDKKR
jgi:hypothetical protein